jgi:hypothetical protein
MSLLLSFVSIVIFTAIGLSVITVLKALKKSSIIEKLSLAFGVGVGVVGIQMLIFQLLNIQWDVRVLLFPWILITFFLLVKNHQNVTLPYKTKNDLLTDKISLLIFISILLLIAFTTFEALMRPLSSWDGFATWLLKAKVFYVSDTINSEIIRYTESDYPLTLGLAITFMYKVIGSLNDKAVLLLYPTFYAALGGMFYVNCRKLTSRKVALLATFLLLSTQNLIRHGGRYEAGLADLPLSFYFFTLVSLGLTQLRKQDRASLILITLFAIITFTIKNEGIPFVIIYSIATLFFTTRKRNHVLSTLLIGAAILSWESVKRVYQFPHNIFLSTNIETYKLPHIFSALLNELINVQNWSGLWIVFMITTILCLISKKSYQTIFIYIVIYAQLCVYVIIFLVAGSNVVEHVKIFDRLLIHLAPIALLAMLLTLKDLKIINKFDNKSTEQYIQLSKKPH